MNARLRSPWPIAAAGAAAAALAFAVAALMAIFGAQLGCLGGGGGGLAGGPTPAGAARSEIPAARLHIYMEAGTRFDISWPFLASIGVQECGGDGHCGVAPSGCAGAMEIAYIRGSECSPDPSVPTIWERFRVDGDGDGNTSIFDPADSIFTAARILRQEMSAPPAGGSYQGYYQAACHYYGACADSIVAYADEVMARALRYGFGHEAKGQPAAVAGPSAPAASGTACKGTASSGSGASSRAIVRIAESQLGTPEVPLGSNCTKYGPCEDWCALFVAWVWQHAGVEMAGGTAPYAYSGSLYGWVKEHGGRVLPPSATPVPGDAALFGWGPMATEHVGIVERVFGGAEITTIDGNYGDRVSRVGPFLPSLAVAEGEPAPIYAYAEPPGVRPAEGGQRGG